MAAEEQAVPSLQQDNARHRWAQVRLAAAVTESTQQLRVASAFFPSSICRTLGRKRSIPAILRWIHEGNRSSGDPYASLSSGMHDTQ